MRSPGRFLLSLALALSLATIAGLGPSGVQGALGSSTAAWPMFQHDAQHTGRSPFVGPQNPVVRWTYPAPVRRGYAPVVYPPSIGPDGTIYATTNAGYLDALSPSDGSVIWEDTTSGNYSDGVAVGPDGAIYVGDAPFQAQRVSSTGQVQWTASIGAAYGYGDVSPPTYANNSVYIASHYTRSVYALQESTGARLWSTPLPGTIFGAPAVGADGTVYVGCDVYLGFGQPDEGCIAALNGSDGSVRWEKTTNGSIWASPTIGPDGTVYVGDFTGAFYALNPVDGTTLWTYRTAGAIVNSAAAVGADGTVYIASGGGDVDAINPSNGSQLWRYQTGGFIESSPVIDASGTIFIGSGDGNLYALRSTDGSVVWKLAVGFWVVSSSVAIGADGTLYVGAGGLASGPSYDLLAIGNATPPDMTPPGITVSFPSPSSGQNGWFNAQDAANGNVPVVGSVTASDPSNVTAITCTDDGAAIIVANLAGLGTTTAGGSLSVAGDGVHSIVCTGTDGASPPNTGAAAGSNNSATVRIDKTPPSITIDEPQSQAYLLNQSLTANYNCTDRGSGIDTCSGTLPNGSVIDTSSTGTNISTVNASDIAGNTSSQSATYSVTYGICPLFDQSKAHKSGSTIPVKLQLCDATGVNVSTADLTVTAIDVNGSADLLNTSGNANPNNVFRYDETLGGYILNLKTTGLASGTYTLDFTVGGDPVTHSVQFVIR